MLWFIREAIEKAHEGKCIRTRIVMVYLYTLCRKSICMGRYSYKNCYGLSLRCDICWSWWLQVFVQELLWFIPNRPLRGLLVLLVFVQELLWFIKVVYKRLNLFQRGIRTRIVMVYLSFHARLYAGRIVFVQELLWFILSVQDIRSNALLVFVQELLWFIVWAL